MFGENLTTEGVDVSGAVIGERWRVGTVELEVCQPRLPCAKLGTRFGDLRMVKRFGEASRPGAYLRIVTEGELGAGDEVEVLSRPEHGITVALVSDAILVDDSLRAHGRLGAGAGREPRASTCATSGRLTGGGDRELVGAVVERLVRVRGAGLVPAHPVPAHGARAA